MTLDEFFNYSTRLSVTESVNERPDLTEYELSRWSEKYLKMLAQQSLAPFNLFDWSRLYRLNAYISYHRLKDDLSRPEIALTS